MEAREWNRTTDEDVVFLILLMNHIESNGGPKIDPNTLLISLQDAHTELSSIKNISVENVFLPEYLSELKEKGYIYKRNDGTWVI